MLNLFFGNTKIFLFVFILLFIFIPIFFIPFLLTKESTINSISFSYTYSKEFNDTLFLWPTPGYYDISCGFGKRNPPTKGASSFHTGIDIKAPTNSTILSICSGTITYIGFNGANGYTIILESSPYTISYSHISPNYMVFLNQFVKKGEIIGTVGPLYITNIKNNPYKDKNGKQTNGATTGPHLHLTIKKDGTPTDPSLYF